MFSLVIPEQMKNNTFRFVEEAGGKVESEEKKKFSHIHLRHPKSGQPIQTSWTRSKAIPGMVNVGCTADRGRLPLDTKIQGFDTGLVGSDWVKESELRVARIAAEFSDINFELEYEMLERFRYGRKTIGNFLSLDLFAQVGNSISSVREMAPGSVITTEFINITQEILREYSLKSIVIPLEALSGMQEELEKKGFVIVVESNGSIPQGIDQNNMYGVMVSESGDTVQHYGLRVLTKIMDVEMLLIANKWAIADTHKLDEIELFQKVLGEGLGKAIESEASGSKERPV